jgi:hypothetical protein
VLAHPRHLPEPLSLRHFLPLSGVLPGYDLDM